MAKFEINSQNIPPDLEPDKNITLWRYMSFASLCEVLMNDYIPLISIDKFSDKSEGIILREHISKQPNSYEDAIEYAIKTYYKSTYVSSWHESKNENASMWDRYTKGEEGVAIKTNAKLLHDSINMVKSNRIDTCELFKKLMAENEYLIPQLIIKRIKYIDSIPSDFQIDKQSLRQRYDLLSFFYKMDDYKDESEIRILKSESPSAYSYINLSSNQLMHFEKKERINYTETLQLKIESASILIQKIVVSPYAHSQFIDTVKQTIRRINFCRNSPIDPNIVIESRRKGWV
ncbi:MAG: DUF2971 domain-containing protein [Ekhidna sp.]|nr:DUF2971 domain-containing protein [Ekhidna sp.]